MSMWIRASLALAFVGVVAGGGYVAERRLLPNDRLLPGLRVDGVTIPDAIARADDGTLAAWVDTRVGDRLDRSITLHIGDTTQSLSLADHAHRPDPFAVVARLRAFGRRGSFATRVDEALRARNGLIDVPLLVAADVAALDHDLRPLATSLARAPVDAKLDLAAHTVHPDVTGRAFDVDGAVAHMSEWIRRCALVSAPLSSASDTEHDDLATCATDVTLPLVETRARIDATALGNLTIDTVVGTAKTMFGRSGDQAPRAVNIERAASKLDGFVLEPGRIVSFNEIVGDRSEANGFKVAWEIFKGEMRPGVGGGTCQVASTFHAAAFFAGIDVVERLGHSRPSAYIQMGLDATVVYPSVDLKVRNPYPFPLVVHTVVAANELRIELLGKEKPYEVAFARDTLEVFPFERRLDEDPNVKPGKAVKKQGGIRGYRIRRTRTMTPTTGSTYPSRVESTLDYYPPTTEIYSVAPGTDPNELPAMPEDVVVALQKKHGDLPPEYADVAVACAGDCEGETKQKLEVEAGQGFHAPTGDQAYASPKVVIKQ